jgi:hypothetical protein
MKTFKQFQEAALAIPAAAGVISKVLPAAAATIGGIGTLMQARKYKTRNNPEGKRKKRKLGAMEKSYHKKELGDRSNDMIVARRGEADKQNKLIDKYEKKFKSQQEKNFRKNVTKGLKGGEVIQDEFSVPTNNASSGNIAGLPPDDPPVKKKKKKKKKYIYGGRGSRKMWMNNK